MQWFIGMHGFEESKGRRTVPAAAVPLHGAVIGK
jgi:hypothetical protein